MTFDNIAICNFTTKPVFVVLFLEILFPSNHSGRATAGETTNHA